MNEKELNIALGKLFNGIELDTHKIEFAVVDELSNKIDDAKSIISLQDDGLKGLAKVEDAYNKYQKIFSDAEYVNRIGDDRAEKLIKELEKLTAKVSTSAKELGLDGRDIPQYKEGLKLLGVIRENRGRSKDIEKKLASLDRI